MTSQERSASRSRGRDAFKSTGRGGMGNMQPASPSPAPGSRERNAESGPDDFSVTRGREPVANTVNRVYTTGRGGAGNHQVSSPTSKRDSSFDANEQEVIREHVNAPENTNFSSGRGGIGNFNRSRSRGPVAVTNPPAYTPTYSSGRGGAGNIFSGERPPITAIDEEERKKYTVPHTEGYHSTGRGGSANFIAGEEPPVERPSFSASEYESTGRGGSGNMVSEQRDRSLSRLQE